MKIKQIKVTKIELGMAWRIGKKIKCTLIIYEEKT